MFALGQQMSSITTRLPASPCTCCRFCCGAGLVLFSRFVCVLGEESRNRPGVNFRGFHGFWKRIPRDQQQNLLKVFRY